MYVALRIHSRGTHICLRYERFWDVGWALVVLLLFQKLAHQEFRKSTKQSQVCFLLLESSAKTWQMVGRPTIHTTSNRPTRFPAAWNLSKPNLNSAPRRFASLKSSNHVFSCSVSTTTRSQRAAFLFRKTNEPDPKGFAGSGFVSKKM